MSLLFSPGDVHRGRPHTRFRTHLIAAPRHQSVPLGLVFGPRALRRCCHRPVRVLVADGVGVQHVETRTFSSSLAIARLLVAELNRSFRRAGVAERVRVGAVGEFDEDESRPVGPNPDAWIEDLFGGRVLADGAALPLECWAARAGVAAVLVLVDWAMSRTGIEKGNWAGFAPWPAAHGNPGDVVFHPVAIADLRCALTAHSAAHEFGHILGCTHETMVNPLASHARGFVRRGARYGLMAAARPNERGRHLEWSRPARDGQPWDFGDAQHDEAAWLRRALPLLARQRFACGGECGGACA